LKQNIAYLGHKRLDTLVRPGLVSHIYNTLRAPNLAPNVKADSPEVKEVIDLKGFDMY
jgi:hypothetical protein